MLNISSKVIQLRKDKKWSQTDLADKLECSRAIIGNYERGENTPSIEIILKMAKLFNVSTDFLISDGQLASYDKEILKRIEDIQNLDNETKKNLFFLIDNVIQNAKTRQAFQ